MAPSAAPATDDGSAFDASVFAASLTGDLDTMWLWYVTVKRPNQRRYSIEQLRLVLFRPLPRYAQFAPHQPPPAWGAAMATTLASQPRPAAYLATHADGRISRAAFIVNLDAALKAPMQ